jgi:hypothetical protein
VLAMSGNVDMKLLKAFFDLRERAKNGDEKAKVDLAKITADPQTVLKIRAAARRTQATSKLAAMAAVLRHDQPPPVQFVGESDVESADEIYGTDEIENAERAHAQLPPGSDSLDHKALLRKNKFAGLNSVAPFVRTSPPSVLAGSVGNQIQVTQGELKQVAFWGAPDDAESCPIAVTVAPVIAPINPFALASPPAAGTMLNRPYARLRFGNRAFLTNVDFDISLGSQLCVSGSQATLEVGLEAMDPTDVTHTVPTEVQLMGALSLGRAQIRQSILTRTFHFPEGTGITTGSAFGVSVPNFGYDILVLTTPSNLSFTIEFFDSDFVVMSSHVVPVAGQVDPIRIPNGCVAVVVANASGSTLTRGQFVFGLHM